MDTSQGLFNSERKKYAYVLLIVALAVFFSVLKNTNLPASESSTASDEIKKDSLITITLTAIGDLMCHIPQVSNAKTSDSSYDFNPSFAEIKQFFGSADLTIGNLETTCAGKEKGFAGYPQFNSPDEYVTALKNAGVNFLVTANNHSMDTDEKGLLRTIEVVRKNNIGSTGTYLNQSDRDSLRILNLRGIQTGILNYTYGANGNLPAEEHKYMLNIIDTTLIEKDINAIRKKGAELVIVFFHFGTEYISEPTDAQKFIVRKTIQYGADIILGAALINLDMQYLANKGLPPGCLEKFAGEMEKDFNTWQNYTMIELCIVGGKERVKRHNRYRKDFIDYIY